MNCAGYGIIQSDAVRDVMLQVDRGDYCCGDAYVDMPQPLGYNATISAPHMHAYSLEKALPHLRAPGERRVLDVGSGSGYLTACFAYLAGTHGKVVGIEHIDELVQSSETNTRKNHGDLLDSGRVRFVLGDGREGHAEGAPYDVIHVGAASGEIPARLVEQLKPGGLMIVPIGEFLQNIHLVRKTPEGRMESETALAVRYVPLTDRRSQV